MSSATGAWTKASLSSVVPRAHNLLKISVTITPWVRAGMARGWRAAHHPDDRERAYAGVGSSKRAVDR
jgi:hypothetical protein